MKSINQYKCRTKNLVEINDESTGGCTTGSDIKFKTAMLRWSLCDYADAYILVKGTITITLAEYCCCKTSRWKR